MTRPSRAINDRQKEKYPEVVHGDGCSSLSSSISSFDMVGLSISLLKSSFPSPFSTSHLLFSSVALPPAIYLRFGFFEMGRLFPFLAVHVPPIPSLTGTLYFSFFSNALSSTTPPRTHTNPLVSSTVSSIVSSTENPQSTHG